ncbi:MAG: phosphate acetyltransferase [bacterium]|nr:MAG: phosphate acetyltransferase [bacterium]
MDVMHHFKQKVANNPPKIVFPEANDERILMAVNQIVEKNIAKPVLIGDKEMIVPIANKFIPNVENIPIISPCQFPRFEQYVTAYCSRRENATEKIAEKLLKKPMLFGTMMVSQGDADGIVCGIAHTTSSVIQAASLTIGFKNGITTPSSLFIMVIPEFRGEKDKILIFADAAVSIKPTAQQLAEIAVVTGRNAKNLLDIEPKIALLSFSTKGSANHEETEKVIQATEIARKMAPDLAIDGELQADTALIPEVAQQKLKESPVAGQSNVLIFPDLNSGNIAYKLVQYLGHAKAIGLFLQGFAKPVSDLSRGASVEDIVGVTAITVVQAQS